MDEITKITFGVTSDSEGWTEYGFLAKNSDGSPFPVMNNEGDIEDYDEFSLPNTEEGRKEALSLMDKMNDFANEEGFSFVRNSFFISPYVNGEPLSW